MAKDAFYESIHKAQFKKDPSGYKPLTEEEIRQLNRRPSSVHIMPRQEKGTRIFLCIALPVVCRWKTELPVKNQLKYILLQKMKFLASSAAGSPFNVYAGSGNNMSIRNYAVAAGKQVKDEWPLTAISKSALSSQDKWP